MTVAPRPEWRGNFLLSSYTLEPGSPVKRKNTGGGDRFLPPKQTRQNGDPGGNHYSPLSPKSAEGWRA